MSLTSLSVGKKIKYLRKSKGITQEYLAKVMKVSCPAVSKWERGETYPDITIIVRLAKYFGVTTDDILGVDETEIENQKKEYLECFKALRKARKMKECFDLIVKSHEEYPDDWEITLFYLWELYYDPYYPDGSGMDIHRNELIDLCKRVLDVCTYDSTRYAAIEILCNLYSRKGEIKKAERIAQRFPDMWNNTRYEMLEQCNKLGSDKWWEYCCGNIFYAIDIVAQKVENAALYRFCGKDAITLLEKSILLIELFFDEQDYGIQHRSLSRRYMALALALFSSDNKSDEAINCLKKSLYHAELYDKLPDIIEYKSVTICGFKHEKTKWNYSDDICEMQRRINEFQSSPQFNMLKDNKELIALLNNYIHDGKD